MKIVNGDWIAVLLEDGSTPVGEIVSHRNGYVEIELISALNGFPMDEFRRFHRDDVKGYTISRKQDAWEDNGQRIMPDQHLWAFQRTHGGK